MFSAVAAVSKVGGGGAIYVQSSAVSGLGGSNVKQPGGLLLHPAVGTS